MQEACLCYDNEARLRADTVRLACVCFACACTCVSTVPRVAADTAADSCLSVVRRCVRKRAALVGYATHSLALYHSLQSCYLGCIYFTAA